MNTITIDNVDYSKNAVYPLKIRYLLDKSLDQATLTLRNLSQEKPFEPLSKVVIDNEFTFLIANDSVKRDVYGSEAKYTHDLLLIEETKLLEKYFVDTCTFTNSLARIYDSDNKYVTPTVMTAEDMDKYWQEYKDNTGISTPQEAGYHAQVEPDLRGVPNSNFYKMINNFIQNSTTIELSMAEAYWSSQGTVTTSGNRYMAIRLYNNDGTLIDSYMNQNMTTYITPISMQGSYYVEYVVLDSFYFPISGRYWNCYGIRFDLAYASNVDALPDITITDVVNRLLAITETQRVGQTPRFSFNSTQATKYSDVLAPEFAMTKCTLREALQQVGAYIHAEPRLSGNVIYFDDLGKREYATMPDNYVSYTTTQDIEQFCSEIDSNVDNLVNTDDEQSGTIVEPFANGLKTTRVEIGTVDIKDDNAFIETTKPIEKIVKVEFGYLNDDTWVGDITPYIYENAEYSALDSYNGIYPYSKAWALYYTQGQKNIYGLQYEQPDAISPYFRKMAIVNIVERVLGTSISATDNPLAKMQFRVTYIPVVNMRIKQHKSYIGSTKQKSVLAYNASANKVDTDYYGENLKGAVERLGNIEKTITYCTKSLSNIPSAGMLFDKDYYISVVTIEFLPNYYRFTLGLSKDFNRWNEYVGINNNQRFYEVSEKQAVERYIVFEDYFVVGDYIDPNPTDSGSSIVFGLTTYFAHTMNETPTFSKAITAMSFTGYDENDNEISTVVMPATSFALGNSAIYQISMDNNFGAGTYIQQYLTNAKGVQIQKEYGDIYGKIETIKVEGWVEPCTESTSYNEAVTQGSKVPNVVPNSFGPEFTTGDANIILKKDSRENINFAYQIHCVTNRDNIIIGSGLPKKFCVKNSPTGTQYGDLYIMDREIGKFEKIITDLPNISEKINYTLYSPLLGGPQDATFEFDTITCNKDGKSVIMVDRETGELLFAINEDVTNGQTYTMPYLMFRHKIYD